MNTAVLPKYARTLSSGLRLLSTTHKAGNDGRQWKKQFRDMHSTMNQQGEVAIKAKTLKCYKLLSD
jgi:hypothetical protein